ncbi:MAG: hypothetical protein EBR59_09450 [Methylococcaceae bacterium]|nr:hypothetical protein [Methylococcaceae bacterium]
MLKSADLERYVFIFGILLVVSYGMPVDAQVAKQNPNSASDQALKKAQGMLRQLSDEKNVLAKENSELKVKLETLEKQIKILEPLKAEVDKLKHGFDNLKESNLGLSGQLQSSKEKLHDQDKKNTQLNSELAQLTQSLTDSQFQKQQCIDNNQQLIAEGQKLQRYFAEKNLWDQVLESEPFTGISHVQVENILQEYLLKLEGFKFSPEVSKQ